MHKYFANTLFLGKKTIYLPQCHSTNAEAMQLLRKDEEIHGTIICSGHQTAGRGQKGNAWISEPDKNLLFSVILKMPFLPVSKIYLLNLMASLAIRDIVSRHCHNSNVEVKWPNDIYINDRKICGILVETTLSGRGLDTVIIGIGLNVNQQYFALPSATSMRIENGTEHRLEDILALILKSLEHYFLMLKGNKEKLLISRYHEYLRWKDEAHTFGLPSGKIVTGTIQGIDDFGKLIIQHGEAIKHYDMKEVSFLD